MEINPYFRRIAITGGYYSKGLITNLICGKKLADFGEITYETRRLFAASNQIASNWHIRIQAAFQRYTDGAISKTVNLPSGITPEEIASIYMIAYQEGLKSITVYRDGSRSKQPLSACDNEFKMV